MKKLLMGLMMLGVSSIVSAEISALDAIALEEQAREIRKELNISSPSPKDKRLERIRAELHLDFDTSSKEALLGNNKADSVQPLIASKEETLSDSFSSAFSSIKKSLNIENEKSYSFTDSLESFYDTIGLEEEESSGVLSMFGLNKEPQSLEIPIFGEMHSTSTKIYKGMKYSGQSAELMSGAMYNSSKVYNTMFGLFDDSPFNIFEEEESSLFDIFD
jgi:hypothetical protein